MKHHYQIIGSLGLSILMLFTACGSKGAVQEETPDPVEKEAVEAIIETVYEEVSSEPSRVMDLSLKEETCTITMKAIETVDHHGNQLLITRSENEDYLEAEKGFAVFELNDTLVKAITGVSWQEGCPVKRDDLRYVQVLYKGFDTQVHIGGLIVHQLVADEILEIFKVLYDADYPIEKVRPIYHYAADDDRSMEANNTSAFNFRVVEGTTKLSKHSYGIAIDINPVQNPYVRGGRVSPEQGSVYLDRSVLQKGMIVEGDPCHEAFKSRGWTWGGDWNTMKDYQHFQKNINVISGAS